MTCDRLHNQVEHGEHIWKTLMHSAERIEPKVLLAACDMDSFFDEGEDFESYAADDADTACYRTSTPQGDVYFIQKTGFEMFFTEGGQIPAYNPMSPTDSYDEYGCSALARLLFPWNHPKLQCSYGFEKPPIWLDNDLRLIEGRGLRFQLFRDGVAVAGMQLENNQIVDLYVTRDLRRQGLASELIQRAEAVIGPIAHSENLTEDGKAFHASHCRRDVDDELSLG
jgi:GNAT superfamily N-acetyltransferase